MAKNDTPAVEMKMQPSEFAELRARVASVKQQDVHLGNVLELLVLHLGHAHGLDPAQEDARLKAEQEQAKAEEQPAPAVEETAFAAPAESEAGYAN